MPLSNDYQDSSVVVPVFTGINDIPRVPTSAEPGNGSDIINRFNTLLNFLDVDLTDVESRVEVSETAINSLTTTQGNQQSTIDDHESRITTLESSTSGGFNQTIILDASDQSDWSNWYSDTLNDFTLHILYLPWGVNFANGNFSGTFDLSDIASFSPNGTQQYNNLETQNGDVDLSSSYFGAGIYLFWITQLVSSGYSSAPDFPDEPNFPLILEIDTTYSKGNFGISKTTKEYNESDYPFSPWQVQKDFLAIYNDDFDIKFKLKNTLSIPPL